MKTRRVTVWLLSLAMLQLGIAGRAECALHGVAAATPVEQTPAHHGAHGDAPRDAPRDAPAPDCESPAPADCCVAVMSCAVVLAAMEQAQEAAASLEHFAVAPSRDTRLFSIVAAPEPPPPRA